MITYKVPAVLEKSESSAIPDPVRNALRERLMSGKIDLPLLPEVAEQVMALSMDEACEMKQLASLIQRDQSMAANLLRLANSALYAPPIPLVTLPQAVSRLGIKKIREIALIISCQTRVFTGSNPAVRALFRHALVTASFAQEVARMRRWNVEESFLCGLLHDVGKPVLIQTLADIQKSLGVPISDDAFEFALDACHASVGASLVENWKLPARLRETILYHHNPFEAPTCGQTAMMTQLADELAHWAAGPRKVEDADLRRLPVLETLNIYGDELDTILAKRELVLSVVKTLG